MEDGRTAELVKDFVSTQRCTRSRSCSNDCERAGDYLDSCTFWYVVRSSRRVKLQDILDDLGDMLRPRKSISVVYSQACEKVRVVKIVRNDR